MSKAIVYTRPDRGVTITYPTAECLACLCSGGYWGVSPRGFLATQIERNIAEGRDPDASRRFVMALAFGGLTQAEAFEVIRDRDCKHLGTAHEAWDLEDLPRDRWFRDAWTRSHNGGPIGIDLEAARGVQWRHIERAVAERHAELDRDYRTAGRRIEIDRPALIAALERARDEDDVRRVWPHQLGNH
jgi:hypothetical protein